MQLTNRHKFAHIHRHTYTGIHYTAQTTHTHKHTLEKQLNSQ